MEGSVGLRADAAVQYGFLSLTSRLAATSSAVWEHATSFDGINYELHPVVRMTAPRNLRRLQPGDITLGERIFRSWILLVGLVPFDYDDLTLVELEPGRRLLERSTMLSQRRWEHERTVEADGDGGCFVTDRLMFEPRVPPTRLVVEPVIGALFQHRHRRLSKLVRRQVALTQRHPTRGCSDRSSSWISLDGGVNWYSQGTRCAAFGFYLGPNTAEVEGAQ